MSKLYKEQEAVYVESINYDDELEGGTVGFAIKPILIRTDAGNLMPMYGLFNRETGIREAENRQLNSARVWAEVLQKAMDGEELPGLGSVAVQQDPVSH